VPDNSDPQVALEALARHLDLRHLTITRPSASRPCLRVTSRAAARLAEDIYAGRGWYWWSWAERISPVTQPAAAAAKIAQVLHTTPQPATGQTR